MSNSISTLYFHIVIESSTAAPKRAWILHLLILELLHEHCAFLLLLRQASFELFVKLLPSFELFHIFDQIHGYSTAFPSRFLMTLAVPLRMEYLGLSIGEVCHCIHIGVAAKLETRAH